MAHVQTVRSTPQTGVSAFTGTITGVAAGSTLICRLWCDQPGRTFSSVSDTAGGTWQSANTQNDGGSALVAMLAVLENAASGDHALTFNITGGTGAGYLTIVEESGVEADSWASGQAAGGGGYVGSQASGNVTPAQAACVVYAFGTHYDIGNDLQALGGAWTDLSAYNSGVYADRLSRQEPNSASAIGATQSIASGTAPMVSQVIVLKQAATGPTINTQPTAQTCTINNSTDTTATFTVSATTDGGALTYQWQLEDSVGGGTYSNISNGGIYSGATSASLVVTPTTKTGLTGKRVRCNVTGTLTTATNAVVLTVYTGFQFTSSTSATTNGSGVATVTWTDDRTGAVLGNGGFVKHIATSGSAVSRSSARPT